MQELRQASVSAIAAAKMLYRVAIDARAADGEGDAWWCDVTAELANVIAAPSIAAAADVITWWHHDWTCVNDSPRAAAARIRRAARAHRSMRATLLAGDSIIGGSAHAV